MATFYRCDRCKTEMTGLDRNQVMVTIKPSISSYREDDEGKTLDLCGGCATNLKDFLKPLK